MKEWGGGGGEVWWGLQFALFWSLAVTEKWMRRRRRNSGMSSESLLMSMRETSSHLAKIRSFAYESRGVLCRLTITSFCPRLPTSWEGGREGGREGGKEGEAC